MGDKMDNLNERLIKETRNTRVVMHKSGTCGRFFSIQLS